MLIQNLLLILYFLSISSISFCQIKIENDEILKIKQKIENYLLEVEQVGFSGSVLVELNGKKIISQGYGFSNIDQNLKNSSETIFDIGSITKQFTSTAILKLEMQGKLSTDDKITNYFKNVPKDKENITIHDLLRHQSGLISNVGKDYERIDEKEFIEKVFSSELVFETGTSFNYSNIGYSLLSIIIEKVSGMDYETYLYENLWKPSQMNLTGYSRPDFDTNLIAVGYQNDFKSWGKPTSKDWNKSSPYWHLKGNGGILSTIEDLYKWHKSLMNYYILSEVSKNKLYCPKLRSDESETEIYAYGWDVTITSRNTRKVWHNGTNNIFYADFLRFIDEDIVIIMMSNKYHQNFNSLCNEISKIIFNPEYSPEIPIADNEENRNFTDKIILTIEEFGLDRAKEEFKNRKSSENLLEFLMRNEGFKRIDSGNPELAIQIFEMNAFAYPKSSKALQGLGEGYFETGNNDLAIKYLKESLEINPENPFVKRLLQKLEN